MGTSKKKVADLVDLKTVLAEQYETWANCYEYDIDYDELGHLLDNMISVLCVHIEEIHNLPDQDWSQE